MRWLGQQEVRLADLVMPANLTERLQSTGVQELAQSIARTGERAIHVPVINVGTNEIVCGRDRIAAHVLRGDQTVLVEAVECTSAEASLLEVAENACRRHGGQDALRVVYARALHEMELGANFGKSLPENPKPGRGRPKSPKVELRKQVAARFGITDRQLRADLKQQGALDQFAEKAPRTAVPAPKPEPRIRLLGVTDAFAAQVEASAIAVQERIDAVDRMLSQAQRMIAQLKDDLPNQVFERLHEQARALAKSVRAERPVSVCPYCKLTSKQPDCCSCEGLGWASERVLSNTDERLLDERNPGVWDSDGRTWRSLASLANDAETLVIPDHLLS